MLHGQRVWDAAQQVLARQEGFVRTKALLAASVMGLRRIACCGQIFTAIPPLRRQAASQDGGHSSRSVPAGRNARLSSLR